MWIQAQLRTIGEVTTGVSQTTGNQWTRQGFVIAFPERDQNNAIAKLMNGDTLCNYVSIDLFGANAERFISLNLRPGQWLWLDIRFTVRTSDKGYKYNQISVHDIAAIAADQQPQIQMPPIAITHDAATQQAAPAPQTPAAPAVTQVGAYPAAPAQPQGGYAQQPLPFE